MSKLIRTFLAVGTLALAVHCAAIPAFAAPVILTEISGPNSPSTTTDELSFAADISSVDLLNGLAGTGGLWNAGGPSPEGLNDGKPGGDFDAVGNPAALIGTAWAMDGDNVSFRDFELGGTYDLTEIQSIAAWQGAGFSNQKYNVSVRYAGDAGFTFLIGVDYQPFAALPLNNGGSTKVNLTDDTGVLASAVEAIRFSILDTVSNDGGGAVYREIDVQGVPSGPDLTSPAVSTFSPAKNASDVPVISKLEIAFDEIIAIGNGQITIRNLDDATQIVIGVPDPTRVSAAAEVLTISPLVHLDPHKRYAVQLTAGAVKDRSGNSFPGIADDVTWNFLTGDLDLTAPMVIAREPQDGAGRVPAAANLVLAFDEPVRKGSGNLLIRKSIDGTVAESIGIDSVRITVLDTKLTIDPASNLASNTGYYVEIPNGAIEDFSGNAFAGFAGSESWNFITASTPLRIMCLGDSITVGYTDNPSWASHPFMFGYRSGLYTRLRDAGYSFQFVGGSTEPWTGISGDPTRGGTYKPDLDLRDFGQDGHRGYGGSGIYSNVNGFITADHPDVILLLIGINGISRNSPAALDALVRSIVTTAPDVHLIVAQITPLATFNQDLFNYNVYIRGTLVPNYAGKGFKVTTVDLYSLFLTNPADYSSAIAPGVLANGINHPDNPHYGLMAQAWFDGIDSMGLPTDGFSRWISGFPGLGVRTGFGDDPDGDHLANGLEAWLGTDPGQWSAGIVDVSSDGSTTTFRHPQNPNPLRDVIGFYDWSADLASWHASGSGPAGGPVITMVPTTVNATTTVTVTASELPDRLYLRIRATRN